MADPEHVEIVRQGAAAIAVWWEENSGAVLDLREADFRWINLLGADLRGANLLWANFSGADLSGANFSWTNLSNTNFSHTRVGGTTFAECDLSRVSGLTTIRHGGPSSIGTDTLLLTYRGAGKRLTPELHGFFAKAGVPASFLDALPRIAGQARYHTAFIAYGEPDRAFAEHLYGDLLSKGVSCWMYAMDATLGARTWHEIGQERREAGKLIVLCSAAGLVQPGPKKEIEEQIDDDRDKIIPISLDYLWRAPGFEVRRAERDLKPFLLERNWADFSPGADYAAAIERLLKALALRPDAPSPRTPPPTSRSTSSAPTRR